MIQDIKAPVSVLLSFNHRTRRVTPKALEWDGKRYTVEKVGYHHQYKKGDILHHVFTVASETLSFRLVFNTKSLHWQLEQISDGIPD